MTTLSSLDQLPPVLSQVTQIIYNPNCKTLDEIIISLQNEKYGTGSPYNEESKHFLIVKNETGIVYHDVSNIPDADFINNANMSSIEEQITKFVDENPIYLNDVKGYEINVLNSGIRINTQYIEGKVSILCLSNKNPNFYDLCAIDKNGGKALTYINRSIYGLVHSGDINVHGSNLIHKISYSSMNSNKIVVHVVGYNKTHLNKFEKQVPTVLIADHENKTLWLVPVPLDKVTIGNSTLCCPLVVQRDGDRVNYSVLSNPTTVDNINTGVISNSFFSSVQRACHMSEQCNEKKDNQFKNDITRIVSMNVETNEKNNDVELQDILVLSVVEDGISSPSIDGTIVLGYGQGINISHEFEVRESSQLVLPCAIGSLRGPLALAVGNRPDGIFVKDLSELYNANVIVFDVRDKMLDIVKQTSTVLCNGLFIVHPTIVDEKSIDLNDKKTMEQLLNGVNINAITAMAGPNAIVLVKIQNRYFFYRGTRWTGLLDKIPHFCEDVTTIMENVSNFATTNPKFPWTTIQSKGDNNIVFQRQKLSLDELQTRISEMGFDDLIEFKEDILDSLTQLQVILTPLELKTFSETMQVVLQNLIESTIMPLKKQVIESIDTKRNKKTIDSLIILLKVTKKKSRQSVNWLIEKIGELMSMKNSSTRHHDLNKMIRKAKINNNVSATKNMTREQIGEMIEQYADKDGVFLANIDSQILPKLLEVVGKQKFLQYIGECDNNELGLAIPAANLTYDPCTAGIMIELTSSESKHPLSGSSSCVALPQGSSGNVRLESQIPFMLMTRHTELSDPSSLQWIEECNEPGVSHFRILLRGTIAQASASRICNISPSSKDLGFFLVFTELSAMTNLVSGLSKEPKFDDNIAVIMRGMFGQLLSLLASGGRPLSMAWQMVMNNPNIEIPNENQWWIYSSLVNMFPFTAWSKKNVEKNVKLFLTRAIRKKITDPATEQLRKNVSHQKQLLSIDYLENRNRQLKWLQLACPVVFYINVHKAELGLIQLQEISERILAQFPEDTSRTGKNGICTIINFFESIDATIDISYFRTTVLPRITQIATNVWTKRSAVFKKSKKGLLSILEEEKNEEVSSAITLLKKDIQTVKDKGQVVDVLMQNSSDIQKVFGGKHDRTLLSGDAEINRVPWSVTESGNNINNYDMLIKFIIEGDIKNDTEHGNSDISKDQVEVKENTLLSKFQGIPGSSKTCALLSSFSSGFVVPATIPQAEFMSLALFLGFSQNEVLIRTQNVIETLLTDWQDTMVAESNALKHWY